MTDTTSPTLFTPPARVRTWRVSMANGSERVVTAGACRTDHGCLVFSEAPGMTMALASGEWRAVEQVPA